MSLVMPHRWEHALLAATVAEAARHCPDCYLGRTAIQKLLYFMKVLGVPMRYDFEIYHYGPFCGTIYSDIEWLTADDVINDTSNEDRYSNYRPGTNWSDLETTFHDQLQKYDATIKDVVHALSDLRPNTLELIATLDFCFRWVHGRGGNGPWKEATIEKFLQIKKDKFDRAEIERWYQTLVDAGLIEQ